MRIKFNCNNIPGPELYGRSGQSRAPSLDHPDGAVLSTLSFSERLSDRRHIDWSSGAYWSMAVGEWSRWRLGQRDMRGKLPEHPRLG